jgi:hypothetical protein
MVVCPNGADIDPDVLSRGYDQRGRRLRQRPKSKRVLG